MGTGLWTIRAQRYDALIVNLAGRQRMLSQKTSKEAWLGLLKGMNLAFNAWDAMPEGGILHISLERVRIEPGEAPPLPDREQPSVSTCLP